jgi:hypothetical protein
VAWTRSQQKSYYCTRSIAGCGNRLRAPRRKPDRGHQTIRRTCHIRRSCQPHRAAVRSPITLPRGSRLVGGHNRGHVHPSKKSGPGFPRADLIRRAVYIRRCHHGSCRYRDPRCQTSERRVAGSGRLRSSFDRRLRLDFGGAATDFCLAGLPTILHDKGPPPANVDIDGLNNVVGNAPISHRTAFQKWGSPRNT